MIIGRFRDMFNIPEEQQMEKWNTLQGLMDEGGAILCAPIPDLGWLSNELPALSLKHLEAGNTEGNWVQWATTGLNKKRCIYQQVDMNQMVKRVNRWGKEQGTRRLSAGDFIAIPNGSRRFQWGYEVGVMMDVATHVFESDPIVWIPNLPLPAAMISQDRKHAVFFAPMIGEGDETPVITEVQPTATFEGFFS